MRCTPEDKTKDRMALPLVQQLTNDFITWLYTAIAQQISLTLTETTVMKVNFFVIAQNILGNKQSCGKKSVEVEYLHGTRKF